VGRTALEDSLPFRLAAPLDPITRFALIYSIVR
jgi:hypothetical protein